MKKSAIVYIIFICLSLCIVMFLPIDYAVYVQDLSDSKLSYYIVEWEQITGSSWKIVGDQNGYYNNSIYITVKGDQPIITRQIHLLSANNKFICYGNFIGMSEIDDIYIYKFDNWDILYPVNRNSLFDFLPNRYVCLIDLLL